MSVTRWEPPAGLDAALKREFGSSARAFPSAQGIGVRLWKLTRDAAAYPVLPQEVRDVFYRMGQARNEFCALPGLPALPAIYEYDIRWAYIAAATGQVCGALTVDDQDVYEPYARGFYRVRFTVPAHWQHVGLLPIPRRNVGDGWWYPTSGEWESTVTWTEVKIALEYGWGVQIQRRWLWDGKQPAPLDVWQDKLLRVADKHPAFAPAVRDIIIRTIGQFHARWQRRRVVVDDPADIPEQFVLSARRDGETGRWSYVDVGPLPAHYQQVCHPEWSADIYGRVRTRLLRYQTKQKGRVIAETGALTVPRADVLALRTDGMWLARDPGWRGEAGIGEMRLRGVVRGPVEAPRTVLDIRDLRALMERPGD